MVECPSMSDFRNMVKMNLLPGSPVSLQDIDNAEFLFGTDMGLLKGKTTRKVPEPVASNYIEVPREIIDFHKGVTIAADVKYINKVPFFTNVPKNQVHDNTKSKQ
eukprot:7056915-Ditylum_brightwellii.AAC.1